MSNYTPTKDEIVRAYIHFSHAFDDPRYLARGVAPLTDDAYRAEFDRWLDQRDQEVREQAAREMEVEYRARATRGHVVGESRTTITGAISAYEEALDRETFEQEDETPTIELRYVGRWVYRRTLPGSGQARGSDQ